MLETESGFEARNPGQAWSIDFDGRGFWVQPDSKAWSWGLQLNSYGFEGNMLAVDEVACVAAESGSLAYDWNTNVQEWYINDTRGLEHSYTVRSRPASAGGKAGPLVFDLEVRGSLQAEVLGDGNGVRCVDPRGVAAVTYAGLHVFDANEETQPAIFVASGNHVSIVIQDRDAVYPLTIDRIAQEAYIKASNTEAGDNFGGSEAVSGNRIIVGAPSEDGPSSGVNGPEGNGLFKSGAAYIFEKVGGTWVQQAYLKASNPDVGDRFGAVVAISGDRAVVGVPFESSNGSQSDNSLSNSGAAYVFELVGGTWTQVAYLKASNLGCVDWFGISVAISGDCIVVGSEHEDSGATGVNSNQNDESVPGSGAASVFERIGGAWVQRAYLQSF
ncbi:MAG: hypothetical protein ACI89E_001038 [Planctomycetota bacterium]